MREEQGISIIDDFHKKPFEFLSNFYVCAFEYNNFLWPSSENAFQAMKTEPENYDKFSRITPAEAKSLGRKLKIREDWKYVKVKIMYEILVSKFSNKDLRNRLMLTHESLIVEGNFWNDNFWGVHHEKGEILPLNVIKASCLPCANNNHLGRLLMHLREHISYTN